MFRECKDGTGTKLIELELTIQHPSTPTPPRYQHILPLTTPPSRPSLHPQTFRIPALHCPTNFSPIHSFKNTWVCVHLLYHKLKECRIIHRKFEKELDPGCLQPMQVHLGCGVPPPMLSVEPGGIYGAPKHQKPLFSAVYIASLFNAFSCTIQQNFMIYTDNAVHIKHLTSYLQPRTLVGNFSLPFSTLFIHLITDTIRQCMLTGEAFGLHLQQRLHQTANVAHTQSHSCTADCLCTYVVVLTLHD